MPRRDGMGPTGMGPLTGRGFGPCIGFSVGRGYRRGLAYGPGFPHWAGRGYAVDVDEAYDSEVVLKNRKTFLERQLKLINQALKDFGEK